MAQVVRNGYPLQSGFAAANFQGVFVQCDIQGHRRAVTAFLQGVGLHHSVWQHRDFVPRHVHRRKPGTAGQIDCAAGRDCQTGCGDVNAHGYGTRPKPLHRQGIVDFCGLRIVNGKGLDRGQRQVIGNLRRIQVPEANAFGKVFQQETLPVELVG